MSLAHGWLNGQLGTTPVLQGRVKRAIYSFAEGVLQKPVTNALVGQNPTIELECVYIRFKFYEPLAKL